MAYRDLEFGDMVRFVNPDQPLHGLNCVVIGNDEETGLYRLQTTSEGTTVCFWAKGDETLIRHEKYAFIIDGKLDVKAKEEYDRNQESLKKLEREKARQLREEGTLVVQDEYGDNLGVSFYDEHVTLDVFGDQLVFNRESVQDIVDHLQKFLN